MSLSILCGGCGGRVEVPDDYTRARLRCPECGVMCDVPADAAKKASTGKPAVKTPPRASESLDPAAERAAEEALFGDDPVPQPEPPPQRRAEPDERIVKEKKPQPAASKTPRQKNEVNRRATLEDDGNPYAVPSLDEEKPCPECGKTLSIEAMLCTGCGYDLVAEKKVERQVDSFDQTWEGSPGGQTRAVLFIIFSLAGLPAMVVGVWWLSENWYGWVFPYLFYVAMLAFVLGTWDTLRVMRNKKGRVRITKMRRMFFIALAPKEEDVRGFWGVSVGQAPPNGVTEIAIFLFLLAYGIIPGVLFWYMAIHRSGFQAALTRDHGNPEFLLYRGGDQALAREIGETVGRLAGMQVEQ